MKVKLFLAIALFMVNMLQAQNENEPLPMAGKKLTPELKAQRLTEHLSLSDVQKDKLVELFKKEEVKMQAVRQEFRKHEQENRKLSTEQKAKFEAFRKQHDAELEKIIGSEKMEKLKAERMQRKDDIKRMAKAHAYLHRNMDKGDEFCEQPRNNHKQMRIKEMLSPENRAERLKKQLSLTDDQKLALIDLFKQQEIRIKEDQRARMEEMKRENDTEIEKIIGKDKMLKLNEIRETQKQKLQEFREVI